MPQRTQEQVHEENLGTNTEAQLCQISYTESRL